MTHQRDRTLASSGLARVEGEGAMHVRVRGDQVDSALRVRTGERDDAAL